MIFASTAAQSQVLLEPPIGEADERHLSDDEPIMEWVHDPHFSTLSEAMSSRHARSIGGTGTAHRPLAGGSAAAGRTDEEIQIVFDRYKSALYRLYNRALRNDPTLRGQVVLRLTIEPGGSVSFCEVQASDMGAPALEQQVVDRVLTFDFGAKENIPAITIFYPIDFLPAA